jgi:hypothetical protein
MQLAPGLADELRVGHQMGPRLAVEQFGRQRALVGEGCSRKAAQDN